VDIKITEVMVCKITDSLILLSDEIINAEEIFQYNKDNCAGACKDQLSDLM
jgi:hypothetical protein